MAGESGKSTHPVELFQELAQTPYSFGFYAALRRIDCAHRQSPRLGSSRQLKDDVVRLSQDPALYFPPSTVSSFRNGEEDLPPRMGVYFMGLFGPNGALPLHLTEYALEREQRHKDRTFRAFADVFHHRMLSLFYRVWASAQPAVSFDRPEDDRFGEFLASLIGMGMPSLRERDAMPDLAKLHFSGRLVHQARNAEGLAALVRGYFGVPADIRQFVGEWLDLPEQYRCRLGETPATGALGVTAIIGSRAYECQHKFRIIFGPIGLREYELMLPGGSSLDRLKAIVRNYVWDEFTWDVNLILKKEEVPPLRLGAGARLGWTSWLGERTADTDADDLTLDPTAVAA